MDPTTVGAAVKFNLSNGWSAPLPCVDLGFGSIKWATGNVKGTSNDSDPTKDETKNPVVTQGNGSIADPLQAGGYYSWMRTSFDSSGDGGTDTATWLLGDSWRMPTVEEFKALDNASNTTWIWKNDWNVSGTDGGNLVTSKVNGLSIFLPAAGFNGSVSDNSGQFWSSQAGQRFYFTGSAHYGMQSTSNAYGMSVRPVFSID